MNSQKSLPSTTEPAQAPVFLHDRAESCGIRDAQVLPVYAGSCCYLHSSMHDEWVQVLEQMLQAAHKILFYDLNDFDQEIRHQFTTGIQGSLIV